MTTGHTLHDSSPQYAQGAALRNRLESLVDWLRLELEKHQIDAETTYDHAAKLLGIVGEMRFLDAHVLARGNIATSPGGIQ